MPNLASALTHAMDAVSSSHHAVQLQLHDVHAPSWLPSRWRVRERARLCLAHLALAPSALRGVKFFAIHLSPTTAGAGGCRTAAATEPPRLRRGQGCRAGSFACIVPRCTFHRGEPQEKRRTPTFPSYYRKARS